MRNKVVEVLSALTSSMQEVTTDILVLEFTVVNAIIIGMPGAKTGKWILIDTGLESSAEFILDVAEQRFGEGSHPQAIILTHGHFDHVGSVIKLSEIWDVPVYAHQLEMPYLTGKKDYPLADSSVDEGLVAKMSPTFPHTSIDIGIRAVPLPSGGHIPGMTDWRWIPTPGHTEGHISLYRENDRTLIVGDAFTTVKQESLLSMITQKENISGPPKYLTTDWKVAEESVNTLRDLQPSLIIPSHGQPMQGEELTRHLEMLVEHFDEIAVPEQGRFVDNPID
ncbi:MAG: MBL fold metallo-hydrolase [Gracilibacter sp. BRH_c7a]|nr:MAG: MBL fold metallo-hydrolase [Gracilibacter sp. BRH_c7a]